MRRTLLWAALAVCFAVGPARPASAQWWSWMEEYSGPGPFKDDGFYTSIAVFCRGGTVETAREPLRWVERMFGVSTADASRCVYVDWQSLAADADPVQGYSRIDVDVVDVGGSVRLHPAVDLGIGAGFVRFRADAAPRAVTTTKFVFVPARVTVRPLLLLGDFETRRQRALAGIVKIYFKQTYVAGRLTGADFGAPANPFHVDGEVVGSAGLVFDVMEALRAWR